MAFADVLNSFCNSLNCTNKEIAERCDISMSALSRYRGGKRTPRVGSGAIDQLSLGISSLAREKGVSAAYSEKDVKEALVAGLVRPEPLGPSFSIRVDSIMKLLRVKNADIAVPLHLDPSYISRIRRGERSPNDKKRFSEVVAQVAALSCMERGMLKEVLSLIGTDAAMKDIGELNVDSALGLAENIDHWLLGNHLVESDINAVEALFSYIDSGYYNEVLEHVLQREGDLSCPITSLPKAEFLQGEDVAWRAEMRFLECSAACGAENLYLSSDMPALGMQLSIEKERLYQWAMVELINRGCQITCITDPDKPLQQSLNALRMWLPLYMTGSVTPLFMEGGTSRAFHHVNNVSECCVVAGEAVRGHEDRGRYYMSMQPEDVAYYQEKMNYIIEKSHVLLEIYRNDRPDSLQAFKEAELERATRTRNREIKAGCYENLRIMLYESDCVVLYLNDPLQFRFVIRHPKLRYVISQMR